MKIKTTNNYSLFKTIEGNRNTIRPHIKKLAESLNKQNLNQYIPIIVNEKMQIIDGQNRLEALKLIKQPVNYIVLRGTDLATVQMLNSSSKSWTLDDYVQSYVKRNNENYIILDEFKKRHSLPLNICVGLLGRGLKEERRVGEIIKGGNFVAKNTSLAEATATYLAEIRKYVDKRLYQDKDFLRACITVIRSDINRKQLIHKLRLFGPTLKRQMGVNDYLREFERIYNFRNQEKIRIF